MDYNINEINPYVIRCGYYNDCISDYIDMNIPAKTVQWYEIELVLAGKGVIVTNGERLNLREGRMFFRVPGMTAKPLCTYKSYFVLFEMIYDRSQDPLYACPKPMGAGNMNNRVPANEQLGRSFLCFDFPHYIDVNQIDRFEELFRDMYNEYINNRFEKPVLMKACLLQILALAAKELSYISLQNDLNFNNNRKILSVQDYIAKNIKSNIKLSVLAELTGLSQSYFCRTFKTVAKETPFEYINKYRIDIAKRMLIETDIQLKEIVSECGFNSYSYFCSQFKRLENKSPIVFRNEHRLMKT